MGNYQKEISYKDIPTILLENRIINLVGEVNDEMAYNITSLLHILNNESQTKPISLYINSPGGSCVSGLSIIDTMKHCSCPIYTIVTGMAASMGAAILSAGDKRFALPNATIMVHQSSGGQQGNIQDMRIGFKYHEEINSRLAKIISENCGMSEEEYLEKTLRDFYMWPEDALPGKFGEKGIIDEIILPKEKKIVTR